MAFPNLETVRMRAGDYRQRITIESKSVSLDALGQEVITWSLVGAYWAKVEDLTGRELLTQGTAETATMTARIFARAHIGTVKISSRITWGDHVYNVRYVANRPEMNDIEIGCFEVVDVS